MDPATEPRRTRRERTAIAVAIVASLLAAAAIGALLNAADDDDNDVVTAPLVASPAGAPASTPAAAAVGQADPDERPITAAEQRRIAAAALELTGPGTVTEIERSDDLGEAYEVEVVTAAGEVDVALNENLRRVLNLRYDELDDER